MRASLDTSSCAMEIAQKYDTFLRKMMMSAGFRLNGHIKIYSRAGTAIDEEIPEAQGIDATLKQNVLKKFDFSVMT